MPAAKKAAARKTPARRQAKAAPSRVVEVDLSEPSMLSPAQRVFVRELVRTGRRAQAYRAAFAVGEALTDQEAASRAAKLLAHDYVRAEYEAMMEAAAAEAGVERARTLRELGYVATSDIGRIVDAEGRMLLPHQLDPATRAAVASFKIDEYGRIEYRFWPKVEALDKLAKHFGLYERDNAQQPPPIIREIRLVPMQPRQAQPQVEHDATSD